MSDKPTCEWVSSFPDMYPEFAPEPIEVACDRAATHAIVYTDSSGYVMGDEPAQVRLVACLEHAAEMARDVRDKHVPEWMSEHRFHALADELDPGEVIAEYHAALAEGRDRLEEQRAGNLHGRNVL